MQPDWRDVSRRYFGSIQPNGLLEPALYTNATGTYDLGVAMAAATCIHPSHREFGVTSGRPRVVGFFDCVAQAEVMQVLRKEVHQREAKPTMAKQIRL